MVAMQRAALVRMRLLRTHISADCIARASTGTDACSDDTYAAADSCTDDDDDDDDPSSRQASGADAGAGGRADDLGDDKASEGAAHTPAVASTAEARPSSGHGSAADSAADSATDAAPAGLPGLLGTYADDDDREPGAADDPAIGTGTACSSAADVTISETSAEVSSAGQGAPGPAQANNDAVPEGSSSAGERHVAPSACESESSDNGAGDNVVIGHAPKRLKTSPAAVEAPA
mmetsp:Transcript_57127/g.185019  ORF Transcript_57127/g.185019 Transcript_57127/m.185019 type:complete len:233 (+) Transcript_57127:255-953(+)